MKSFPSLLPLFPLLLLFLPGKPLLKSQCVLQKTILESRSSVSNGFEVQVEDYHFRLVLLLWFTVQTLMICPPGLEGTSVGLCWHPLRSPPLAGFLSEVCPHKALRGLTLPKAMWCTGKCQVPETNTVTLMAIQYNVSLLQVYKICICGNINFREKPSFCKVKYTVYIYITHI